MNLLCLPNGASVTHTTNSRDSRIVEFYLEVINVNCLFQTLERGRLRRGFRVTSTRTQVRRIDWIYIIAYAYSAAQTWTAYDVKVQREHKADCSRISIDVQRTSVSRLPLTVTGHRLDNIIIKIRFNIMKNIFTFVNTKCNHLKHHNSATLRLNLD